MFRFKIIIKIRNYCTFLCNQQFNDQFNDPSAIRIIIFYPTFLVMDLEIFCNGIKDQLTHIKVARYIVQTEIQ